MNAVAVTHEEGGEWVPFLKGQRPDSPKGRLVHSIVFDNGVVWDACNGWRRESLPRVRVKMGKA